MVCLSFGSSFALDREAFTFTHYELEIQVEPAQQRLGARGKITLRNDSTSSQRNLVLQISSSLNWRSIQMNGRSVQFLTQPYASDIDHTGAVSEAVVTLPQEIAPKATVELEIGYEGIVPLDATRLTRIGVPDADAKHSDWDQIGKSFTAIRGIGYVAWYAVATEAANLSEGNDLFETLGRWNAREDGAQMSAKLCQVGESDSPSEIVTNAETKTAEPALPSPSDCTSKTFSFSGAAPAFAIAPYSQLTAGPLAIYYLPEHKTGAEDYALASDLTTPFVTGWFGPPRAKVQVVDLTDSSAAPFESGNIMFAPMARSDSRLAQLTVVHLLTHAAFQSSRPWIYEGLAHFAQALYRENQSGRQAALDFMGLHASALAQAEKTSASETQTSASTSLVNSHIEEFYRSKAMFVWWMLRDMLGEPALKKALTNYHADQDKEPSYVQRLIAAQSSRDLEWFFDDWVYRDRGVPDFRVDSVVKRDTVAGGSVLTITVVNVGSAGAEVPVTLHMEVGGATKRVQVNAKSKESVRIEAPSPLVDITVNDGSIPEGDLSNNVYRPEEK